MNPILRVMAAMALSLACANGLANTLYKCGSNAAPSYQTEPCAAGVPTLGQTEYEPEATLPQGAGSTRLPRGNAGRAASTSRPSRRRAVAAPKDGHDCADVRRRRDAWERSVGLRRTYDELRAWNDRVRDACR